MSEKIKNVFVLELGKVLDGNFYSKKLKIKFPKSILIQLDWNQDKIIGKASNFKQKGIKVYCDVVFENLCNFDSCLVLETNYTANISGKGKQKKSIVTDVIISGASITFDPIDVKLKYNLKIARGKDDKST